MNGFSRFHFAAIEVFCMILLLAASATGGTPPPEAGQDAPDFYLDAPARAEDREYLGLSENQRFRLSDIGAEAVIVEIFSMYCPHCQKEAPSVNRLFRLIEAEDALRGRIKIIGIGVGNSPFEVDFFRKTYDIPFPLFPDGKFVVHEAMGQVRTPFFMVTTKNPDGSCRVALSRLGAFESPEAFLREVLERTGLHKGESK